MRVDDEQIIIIFLPVHVDMSQMNLNLWWINVNDSLTEPQVITLRLKNEAKLEL